VLRSYQHARDHLKRRVAEIVRLNPWLAGRLIRHGEKKVIALVHKISSDEKSNGSTSFFVDVPLEKKINLNISKEKALSEICSAVKDASLLVKKGSECINKDEDLFRVSIAPTADEDCEGYAVIFSMSHVIGDGYTYYTLLNMLSEDRTPTALSPKRKYHVDEEIRRKMESQGNSPGFLVNFIGGSILSGILGPKTKLGMFYLDSDWVRKQKEASRERKIVPFVSTNDIFTSHFFKACKASMGWLVVNFRGRMEDCETEDAGNYQNVVGYRPPDFDTPDLIRLSLKDMKRASRPLTSTPKSFFEHLGIFYGIVTNWTSFAKEITINGQDIDFHIPLGMEPEAECSRILSSACVFRARKDRIGIMVIGHPDTVDKLKASALAMTEKPPMC